MDHARSRNTGHVASARGAFRRHSKTSCGRAGQGGGGQGREAAAQDGMGVPGCTELAAKFSAAVLLLGLCTFTSAGLESSSRLSASGWAALQHRTSTERGALRCVPAQASASVAGLRAQAASRQAEGPAQHPPLSLLSLLAGFSFLPLLLGSSELGNPILALRLQWLHRHRRGICTAAEAAAARAQCVLRGVPPPQLHAIAPICGSRSWPPPSFTPPSVHDRPPTCSSLCSLLNPCHPVPARGAARKSPSALQMANLLSGCSPAENFTCHAHGEFCVKQMRMGALRLQESRGRPSQLRALLVFCVSSAWPYVSASLLRSPAAPHTALPIAALGARCRRSKADE